MHTLPTSARLLFLGPLVALAGLAHATILESRTSSGLQLSPAAGQKVNIVNMTVPAGQWVATAKASAINWGTSDYVRCVLTSNGQVLDGATTMTGEASGQPAVAELVTHARLSLTAPTNVSLTCSHDRPVAGQYIDPGATLLVVSDASGTGGTGPAGPPGPAGPAGPAGQAGPAVKTSAVCVGPILGPNPTSRSCLCSSAAKTVVSQQGEMQCSVTSDTGSCSANGQIVSQLAYTGACCVCAP